jgi:two-component system, cell cycle response regulator DivK
MIFADCCTAKVEQMAPPEPSAIVPERNPASGRKCVLIVEDNPLNMKLFSAMIASQGYDVLQALDGHQGLAMAQQHRPDLVIMDVQLPGMSGLEVAQTLKADDNTRGIRIIATTAYALSDDEQKIIENGCDAYMAKPIAITEFLELIEFLMARPRQATSSIL